MIIVTAHMEHFTHITKHIIIEKFMILINEKYDLKISAIVL